MARLVVKPTSLPGVLELEPQLFGDHRGFFLESFNQRDFSAAVGAEYCFVQDNHSVAVRNSLRGLHYQVQRPQGKLLRVVAGVVFDVAVDIRRRVAGVNNPCFGHWVGVVLSAQRHNQLWVPPGFAHGFLVLSESAEVLYKATDYWFPEFDRSLRWDDADVGLDWRGAGLQGEPILSAKDRAALPLSEVAGMGE